MCDMNKITQSDKNPTCQKLLQLWGEASADFWQIFDLVWNVFLRVSVVDLAWIFVKSYFQSLFSHTIQSKVWQKTKQN